MNENDFASLKELVLRYNESIIESGSDAPAFTSKLSFQHSDLAERISQFNWFSNCGKSSPAETTMPIRFVESFAVAQSICSRFDWENFKIDANNQLSLWLNQNHKDEYQKWNTYAIANNKIIDSFIGISIRTKLQQLGLHEDIAKYVRADMQNVFIANDYLFTGHTCYFAFELLNVYNWGNIPCGWVGDWPAGYLVAF